MHKIDLSKYLIRTDMAVDLINNKKYNVKEYYKKDIKVSMVTLDENNNIGKKPGKYLTIEFSDVTDDDYKNKVTNIFKDELRKFCNIKFNNNFKTIIIGLGNINSTPDSLGPLVVQNIIVTKHLFDMKIDVEKKFSNVSILTPGVTGTTGIETKDYILGIVNIIKPDLIITIDALSSNSISRVNRSIQVTNSGISPGSGVGNKRVEISKETLNIPVISIGIPTVVDAAVIVSDTINYMSKNYSYNKGLNKNVSKFITKPVNYKDKNIEELKQDRKNLLGLIGTLSEDELIKLTNEVLTPIGYNFMVTPKEEDFVIKKLSEIVSDAINKTIHNI